jgi:hypothetical protein
MQISHEAAIAIPSMKRIIIAGIPRTTAIDQK